MLALGRGAGAAAFRVDFFVRWGDDPALARPCADPAPARPCAAPAPAQPSADGGHGQMATLYLNEVGIP